MKSFKHMSIWKVVKSKEYRWKVSKLRTNYVISLLYERLLNDVGLV